MTFFDRAHDALGGDLVFGFGTPHVRVETQSAVGNEREPRKQRDPIERRSSASRNSPAPGDARCRRSSPGRARPPAAGGAAEPACRAPSRTGRRTCYRRGCSSAPLAENRRTCLREMTAELDLNLVSATLAISPLHRRRRAGRQTLATRRRRNPARLHVNAVSACARRIGDGLARGQPSWALSGGESATSTARPSKGV